MTKNFLWHVFNDLAGVSSYGRLCQRNPMDNMSEIAGSDGIWSHETMFFSKCLASEGALRSVTIVEHVLRSMVKSVMKNDMEGDSSLGADEVLGW
jgi:hypothetical protein